MPSRRILFVNQEISPYSPETEVSKFVHDLSAFTSKSGRDIRTLMPRYNYVSDRKHQLHEVIRLSGMNLIINNFDHQLIIKVGTMPNSRAQVYFIDNDEYFEGREPIYASEGVFHEDNDERMMFFCRGSLEAVRGLAWEPTLIHVNGWFASMVPFYIRRIKKGTTFFHDTKLVISIFGDDFEQVFPEKMEKKLKHEGATAKDLNLYKNRDFQALMRTAITYSQGVVVASPNANPELVAFAKECKKNVLDYNPDKEQFFCEINKFYDTIIGTKK